MHFYLEDLQEVYTMDKLWKEKAEDGVLFNQQE